MSGAISKRIKLLISVRNAAEAIAALDGGADIIDVKEPSRGSLGMADHATIQAILATVANRLPVSAALGELSDTLQGTTPLPPISGSSMGRMLSSSPTLNLRFIKLGLAHAPLDWAARLSQRFNETPEIRPIAAAYADADRAHAPPVHDVLNWAIRSNAAGVLIDTFIKDGRGLFDWLADADIAALIEQAHAHHLLVALAGSLRGESLNHALSFRPDIVAVRGAACGGNNRLSQVDTARVRDLAELIAVHNAQPALTEG